MTSPVCILIVEDEVIIALSKKNELEAYGYDVRIVTTGEDAIAESESNAEIDLILMDIDLGAGIDGTVAAEAILLKRNLPIVFFSSHSEPDIVRKTERISSYGYVTKNSGTTVLDASIKMALKLFNANIIRNEIDQRYRNLFDNLSDAFVVHEIILDENGKPADYRFLDANKVFLERAGLTLEQLVGRTALELFSKTEKEWIEAFGRVALSGISEVVMMYSQEFDNYYEARIYSPGRGVFAALFIDVKRIIKNYTEITG